MLGKLMKYEIKATARWFLPLYAAILLMAAINRLLFTDPLTMEGPGLSFREMMTGLSMFTYVILIFGVMIATFVVCIIRFYKSLLGDEGYLMFTLPVKTWQHILNKLLIAMLWSLLSVLVAVLSICIIVPMAELAEIRKAFAEFGRVFGTGGYVIIPLLTVISLVLGILKIYLAIALGHLFNKHKLLASFGMYIGINTVSQFALMLIMPIFVNSMLNFNGEIEFLAKPINQSLLLTTVISAVLAAGCYVLTDVLLKKKLNLE